MLRVVLARDAQRFLEAHLNKAGASGLFKSHLCLLVVGLKVEYLHCAKLSISKSRLQIEIIHRTFQTYEMGALHHTPCSRGPLRNGPMQRDVGSPPCDSATQ